MTMMMVVMMIILLNSDVDYYDEGSDNYDDASCSTLGNSRVQGDLI